MSGLCGLVYEIAWLKVMSLVFGNTTFATSTVLSSYMAGLGLGALYFGKKIDAKGEPVATYGLLEAGVGFYALITPLIWKLIDGLNIVFYHGVDPEFMQASLFKFIVAFTVLFIPSFLMGGTLPVVSKFFVRQKRDTARYVGLLYALNTLGAVIGVLFSGFYAIYALGLWQTVLLTGAINFMIYGVCCYYAPEAAAVDDEAQSQASPPAAGQQSVKAPVLLCLFSLSGAVSMIYEVGWTRVMATVLGSSVYAFSVMLATFLLGIALGSFLFSVFSKRFKADLMTFSALQMLTALSSLIGINFFDDIPYFFIQLFVWARGNSLVLEFGRFLLCSAVMFMPTLMIGAAFTCFIHIYRRTAAIGTEVGAAYFFNTIGAILGSALTGFLIIPAIGIQKTLLTAGLINAGVGVTAFFLHRPNFVWKRLAAGTSLFLAVGIAVSLVKPWNLSVMDSSDSVTKPWKSVGLSHEEFQRNFLNRGTLFHKDGPSATVSVTRARDNIALTVNGKTDASDGDALTQYYLGHLPMLLHPNPKKVLIIGLGSASTLAAAASHPAEVLHVVELEPAVVEASEFFLFMNRNVLRDPRVKLFVNDGRNALLVRPDLYDIIISEPSNPWMAGVANLFSLENFQTMSSRLKPGGVACQWLHAYNMGSEDIATIVRTFSEAFAHVQLWRSDYPDLMLIGRNEKRPVDFARIQGGYENPQLVEDLGPYGLRTPGNFLATFWLDDTELRLLSREAPIHRDNRPILEYSAPRHLYEKTGKMNFEWLNRARTKVFPPMENINPPPEKNVALLHEVAKGYASGKFYQMARRVLNMAVETNPDHPGNLEVAGILHYLTDNKLEAARHLTQAVQANPESADGNYYLGKVLMEQGDSQSAVGYLRRAVELTERERHLQAFADALFKAHQLPEALKVYEEIIRSKGRHFGSLERIVSIQVSIGSDEEKLASVRRFVKSYPLHPTAYLELGWVSEKQEKYEVAAEAFRSFIRLYPNSSSGYINLARIYDKMGRGDEMRNAMREAVRIEPELLKNSTMEEIIHA
ncbi:MAG: fused MFS/spermidine synthase [Candidatus Omnitrophota bacterium]|nr:fused MFS/spermidine synthase [Candidatus Omnitrophota bacterium]